MNTTIARQGTRQNPVLWEIRWDGQGWYAGAEGRTEKLDANTLQEAQQEARWKGLGTPTFHLDEESLIKVHGNNW